MKPIPDLARQLLVTHRTTQAAADALFNAAQLDQSLYQELTKHALRDACMTAIRRVAISERNLVWNDAAEAPVKASVQSWGRAIGQGLLDQYRLTNGTPLGDGTADEVYETITRLEEQATDMLDKGAWLRLIASQIKPGKTVRQSISEKQAHKLQAQVLSQRQTTAAA